MSAILMQGLIGLSLALGAPPGPPPPPPGRQVVITVGQAVRVQMSDRQRIKRVFVDNPAVVQAKAVANDPTTILVIGMAPGRALITLTGENGKEEMVRIGR